MDQWQILFNIAAGGFGVVFGWMINIVFDELKTLRKANNDMINDVSKNYVRRDDFKEMVDAMFKKLDRIEDKLNEKADKDK